jgi:DNA-binding SARP family transcriptional activator
MSRAREHDGRSPVRFVLAGDVAVDDASGTRHRVPGGQPRACLALLVLERHRPISREEFAHLLWGDDLPPHWSGAVRGVVTKVRRVLVAAGLPADALRTERGWMRLDIGADSVVDVEQAAARLNEADGALARRAYDDAIAIVDDVGPVLDAGFAPGAAGVWVEEHQYVQAALARRAAHMATRATLLAGRPTDATVRAEAALERDPYDEELHRLLIEALAADGHRQQARAAYERLRELLAAELGVAPAQETERAIAVALGSERLARSAPSPKSSAPAATPSPGFVGRDDELHLLGDAWNRARDTASLRCVLVDGEAGAGKTRLAREALAALTPPIAMWGTCAIGGALPYRAIVEALRGGLGAQPATNHGALGDAPDIDQLLAGTAGARAVAATDADPVARLRLFHTVASAFAAVVASASAGVLVIDDLHWADADSLALLDEVLRALEAAPLLVVLAFRPLPGTTAGTVAEWQRRYETVTVRLRGLDDAAVTRLLVDANVATEDGAAALGAIVRRRTGGNPFYIDQLLRSAAVDKAFDANALPAGVRDWIDRRIAALPAAPRALLGLAATIGRECDLDLLQQCSGLASDDLVDASEVLVRERLLDEDATGFHLAFAHDLSRDAVYEGLAATRRAWLHARVARALEASAERPGRAGTVAYHWSKAGPSHVTDVHRWSLIAAETDLQRAAWASAAERAETAARAATTPHERINAAIALGQAMRGAGDRMAAREALESAADLARAHGIPRALGAAVLRLVGGGGRGVADDLPDASREALLREALAELDDVADADLVSPLLGELALALMLTDDDEERAALANRGLHVARTTGDDAVLARALLMSRLAGLGPENARARLAAVAEVLALPEPSRPPEATLAALLGRHEDLLLIGDRSGARAALEDAERVVDRYDHPYWRWAVTTWRALDAIIDGRLDDAETLAFAALAHQAEHPEALACLGVNLVDIRLYQGRPAEMLELLQSAADANPHIPCYRAVLALCASEAGEIEQARDAYRFFAATGFAAIPDDTNRLLTLAVLADVAAALGDAPGAPTLLHLLAPYHDCHVLLNCFGGGGSYWGPVSHQLARLAAATGDDARAASYGDQAERAAAAFGAPLALARIRG